MDSLPSKPYSKTEANKLYAKSSNKGMKYINSYFYRINNPPGCFLYWNFNEKQFNMYDIKKSIETFIPKDHIKQWMESQVYTQSINIDKPIFFDRKGEKFLNTFLGMKHDTDKKLSEMDEYIQKGVKFIWKHCEENLCNNDKEQFSYFHDWTCNTVCGRRNCTALYNVSRAEGTGKNTFSDFLREKVFGNKVSVFIDDPSILTSWNEELEGKLFVVFEEMQSASKSAWSLNSEKMKPFVVDKDFTVKRRYHDNHKANINFNIVINANKKAIKVSSSDRRYFMIDISKKRVGDFKYWEKLHEYTEGKRSEEIALGFYRYCHENGNPERNMREIPVSNIKQDSLAESLSSELLCVKNRYLLLQKDLVCKYSDFYDVYDKYCSSERINPSRKEAASGVLRDNGIPLKKKHGNKLWVDMKYEELKELFEKKHWIHETDEFVDKAEETKKMWEDDEDDERDEIIKKQQKEIEELKKQIEELKSQQKLTYTNLFDDEITLDKKDVPTNFNLPKLAKMIEEDKKPKPKEIEIIHKKTKKVEPKKVEPKKELIEEDDEDLFMVII